MIEDYVQLGILLKTAILVSQGTEMSFMDGKVVVKRRDGTMKVADCPGTGISLSRLDTVINLALGGE